MTETETPTTTETAEAAPVDLTPERSIASEVLADEPAEVTKHTAKKPAKKAAKKPAVKAAAKGAKKAKKPAVKAAAKGAKKAKGPKRSAGHKAQCNVHKDAWKMITAQAKEQKVRDADVVRDLIYRGLKFKEPAAA